MAVTFNWQVIPKDKLEQMNLEAKAEGLNVVAWLKSKWSVTFIIVDRADPYATLTLTMPREKYIEFCLRWL